MDIIPVIDLLHGLVVRARRGERQLYRPMESRLCRGSEPLAIVQALLELYPFKTLYIADLDAIAGHGNHQAVISTLRARYPQLDIWLDAGLRLPQQLHVWHDLKLDLVIGSEGLVSRQQYENLAAALDPSHLLLSLDFNGGGYIGAPEILSNETLWPNRMIAMTLARVGSGLGPDLELLQDVLARAGSRQVIAAGGIRDQGDLAQLRQLGVAAVLVASALHDGGITGEDLML